MPDERKHRGPHPEDLRLFGPDFWPVLRSATDDLCWLLGRAYAHDSALKLVGDRYGLVARQRIAVSRCACSDADARTRASRQVGPERLVGSAMWIDGYNVLTTIEAALAGGILLAARDGTSRDMASMHGSYRKVAETLPALELLGSMLASLGIAEAVWYLDRPVSNSGRLKRIIEDLAELRHWPWRVELSPNPDHVLVSAGRASQSTPGETGQSIVVASADSVVLDRCGPWFNLARETVVRHIPVARIVG
jgi:hypothetical protein